MLLRSSGWGGLWSALRDPATGRTNTVNRIVGGICGTRRGLRRVFAPWDVDVAAVHREKPQVLTGAAQAGNVPSETNPAVDSLFLFTARPFDADTGLQNNLNRWYDPVVGRWMSEDPIGFAGGDVNLYRYVRNMPISFSDCSGYQSQYPIGAQYPGNVLTPGDILNPAFDPYNPQPQRPVWPFVPRPNVPTISTSRPSLLPQTYTECLDRVTETYKKCIKRADIVCLLFARLYYFRRPHPGRPEVIRLLQACLLAYRSACEADAAIGRLICDVLFC